MTDKIQNNDKGGHQGVLVVAEHSGGEVSPGTLQLTGKARELADRLKVNVISVILGDDEPQLQQFAQILIRNGADEVYLIENPELTHFRSLPYTRAIAELIEEIKPEIVLFSASTQGRDMAPRVAARIHTGLTADCTNLLIDDYEDKLKGITYKDLLYQVRPAFGGDVMATIVTPGFFPQMATVRRDVFDLPLENPDREGWVKTFRTGFKPVDLELVLEEYHRSTKKGVDLKKARVIVSGGRGLSKDPEKGFALMRELADLMGGDVGASRGAVDRGWVDHGQQVGQTGQTVKPEVYVACGISGAVQHLAGMSGAKTIIAINNDPEASIFKHADYGIVGDVFDVLPKMIDYLKNGK